MIQRSGVDSVSQRLPYEQRFADHFDAHSRHIADQRDAVTVTVTQRDTVTVAQHDAVTQHDTVTLT
ncbi:hypothetical protein [Nonomuraea basaltis]|uniref:hypothetical protein n=1 Tax=Nonomuraea basaltis TaxID=2495887 RepID=UPI00110C4AB1|nr:hypothetical protein [Nonomuraea basaltis]TMR96937.1 hypothetical protein EJK15_20355 [Nonomuraea basaltis]